jgi:hypothetical protein
MLTLHPQFIKDTAGNNTLVVLPVKEFNTIIEDLEDLEDILLYDDAKKNDTGERICFEDYLKQRKERNA